MAAAANELRADHSQVTDEQAEFVRLLVQTGQTPAQLARITNKFKNLLYYNVSRAHVADYRQAVSVRVLGGGQRCLEAVRDILDRSGLSLEPARPKGPVSNMNFNLNGVAPAPQHEPLPVDAVIERMGPKAFPNKSGVLLKSAIKIGEGGSPHITTVRGLICPSRISAISAASSQPYIRGTVGRWDGGTVGRWDG